MKNKLNYPPSSKKQKEEIVATKFPKEKPIFWGPGQLTGFPEDYQEPQDWKKNRILQIPRVLRYFDATSSKDLCGDPTPPGITYKLMETRYNIPPYPFDFILVWDRFVNGVRSYSPVNYSTTVGENIVVGGTIIFSYTVEVWIIGMTVPAFPPGLPANVSVLPLDYIINGTSGQGFYTRTAGVKVTPTFPE